MKAPPVPCDDCGHVIGTRTSHMLTGSTVRCLKCFTANGKHAEAFPACPDTWHDMHDHPVTFCTRAGIRYALKKAAA